MNEQQPTTTALQPEVEPADNTSFFNNLILGIMFCEFDIQEGPKILYQRPYEIINKPTFDSISSYIIPKTQLKNRIITISVDKFKICGFPIYIDHAKYNRNQYIFNICFVFDHTTNSCSYEAVIKKLACDLRTLEVESAFLSTEKFKQHLPKIMEQIQTSLNTTGECIIQKIANLEHSAMFLKIIKNHVDPQIVQSFDVPVFLIDPNEFEIDDWDLTTQKIVFSINGFKTVSLIANETNIEQNVVKEAVQNLIYAGILALVPIIQYSSMFMKTSKLAKFYADQIVQAESSRFCHFDKDRDAPSFYDIFTLLNAFNAGFMVKDINEFYNPEEKNIDIKKLILFGLMKGYLRKVNKYPISLADNLPANETSKWLTGHFNYDKICSSLGLSVNTIEEQLDEDCYVTVCIK